MGTMRVTEAEEASTNTMANLASFKKGKNVTAFLQCALRTMRFQLAKKINEMMAWEADTQRNRVWRVSFL
ncbi:uncharacterized protein PHALS_11233 [Plasmopara halstedii]|uniref:Uncharacterized protein n=1 Tax=Plasmopara halstedii TaxID=4781 RepID=A0A0P1AIF4_PLAHL|nr:uncharacterized protein PHALS_11233 [Plasmopara halstedii]CEG41064.1 hypothetical protein PHALS_11233 [Plasmopara halstedii]|eukprot:XP_024577433.1 hypothetical protein PHALS_11233 [Plasmopara halstedii]